jgi:hypothetical protein
MAFLLVLGMITQPAAHAYVLNRTIAASGGCPQPNAQPSGVGQVDRRWNTTLGTNILTTGTGTARTTEVEQVILESFSVWTGVGTSLNPSSLAGLTRIANPGSNDCNSNDALNTICFAQSASFQTGVLAFTTSVTSDILGEHFGSKTSSFIGQIFDADVLFNPAVTFATPSALTATAYDLESVLTHELGHFFGFSHSAVLRAMMYPFAPDKGTFRGIRPTQTKPDAPLADDDRAGLRVMYPNPSDPNIGIISGFILSANPALSLAGLPPPSPTHPAVTGVFGAHVVAVDSDTGAVVAGTLGGWSCETGNLPTKFDGFFKIEGLPVADPQGNPRHYKIFVEPLDQPTDSTNIPGALADLCRSDVPQPCTVPAVNTNFTTKIKP